MQQHQTHLLLVYINLEVEHVSEMADCGLESTDFEIGADAEKFAHFSEGYGAAELVCRGPSEPPSPPTGQRPPGRSVALTKDPSPRDRSWTNAYD